MSDIRFDALQVRLYRVTTERYGVKIIRYFVADNAGPVARSMNKELAVYGGKLLSIESLRAVNYVPGLF